MAVHKLALCLLLLLGCAQAAFAVPDFSPQRRVGYTTGDQWEPALTADGHGHVYILFPQYGPVSGCASCTAPSIALLGSNDNGLSLEPGRRFLPSSPGKHEPPSGVDAASGPTAYYPW